MAQMPSQICIMASVMMKEGMPILVTPKAVTPPSARQVEIAEDDGEAAGERNIGDVHARILEREEGDDDAGRIGDAGDAKIDLGGENDEGEADRDDAGDRHLLQDVLQIAEGEEGGAGEAEEDDQEQKRQEGRDIAQLVAEPVLATDVRAMRPAVTSLMRVIFLRRRREDDPC